jgi:hypothetical protein
MKKIVFVLVFAVSVIGCASMVVAPPALQNRVLLINPDAPGFRYEYQVCVKSFFGSCIKTQMHVDTYDLTDPVVRAQLINMGFVAAVAEKITP